MVIETIAALALGILGGLLSFLPDAGDSPFGDLGGFVTGYSMLNAVLPLSEAASGIAALVGLAGLVFVWHLVTRLWALIPGKFS